MLRRSLVLVLMATFTTSPALAGDLDISSLVKEAATRAAAQTQRPAARDENPYLVPSLAPAVAQAAAKNAQLTQQISQEDDNPYLIPGVLLVIGGGVLMISGVLWVTGVECVDTRTTFSCGTTHSKSLIGLGVAAAGAGGYLIYKGNRRKSTPQVVFGPSKLVILQQISW